MSASSLRRRHDELGEEASYDEVYQEDEEVHIGDVRREWA